MITLQELLGMQVKGRKIRYLHEIYIAEELVHYEKIDLYFLNLRLNDLVIQVPKSSFEYLYLIE